MAIKSKRIGTFKEFLRDQKKLNEGSVNIQVEWWDQAIVEVMQDLADECGGFLSWDILTKYVRDKNETLGRDPYNDFDDDETVLLHHVKELIFQHHSDSLCHDSQTIYGTNKADIQSKAVVLEQLAKVILQKVIEQTNTDIPSSAGPQVKISDPEKRTLVPMKNVGFPEDEDDDILPFDEHRQTKKIQKFDDYIKAKELDESVAVIDTDKYNE